MTIPPLPDPHAADLDPTDAALRAAYVDLVDDLGGRLDLAAGADQATEPGPYQSLTHDLAHHLDLEHGLAAITGGPPTSTSDQPRPGSHADPLTGRRSNRPVVLSAAQRLELRVTLRFRYLRDLLVVDEALALDDLVLDPDSDLELAIDLGLARTRNLSRNLPHEADLALTRVRDLGYARNLALSLIVGSHLTIDLVAKRAADLDRALTRAHQRDRARQSALDRDPALDHDFACAFDLIRGGRGGIAWTHDRVFVERLQSLATLLQQMMGRVIQECHSTVWKRASDLISALGLQLDVTTQDWTTQVRAVLDDVADDFIDVDVRAARLPDRADLTGVRWSSGTRWPPGWEMRVRATSQEIAPGIFEVVNRGQRRSSTFAAT